MAFKREVNIRGEWIDLNDLTIRNLERCDGCDEILSINSVDQAPMIPFRIAISNDSRDIENSMKISRMAHRNRTCVTAAVLAQVNSWCDSWEEP